jgi:hypothetical protein
MEAYMQVANQPTVTTSSANVGDALSASGVSWGAVFAGAVAAAALSLILVVLGTGLGMSAISPWAQDGISATTFGISTVVWVIFMAVAASAMGGYLAGRLRTKWVGVHTDEVFFRDTAHGFLAWGVATLLTAALLTSATAAFVSGGVKASAAVVGGTASAAGTVTAVAADTLDNSNPERSLNYFIDSLFRDSSSTRATDDMAQRQSQAVPPEASPVDGERPAVESFPANTQSTATINNNRSSQGTSLAEVTPQVTRIFINAIWHDQGLPQEDVTYVAQLISEHTSLTQQQAEERVSDTYARLSAEINELEETAKEAADTARAASAYAALWFFVSLLLGAFTASIAATIGGRQRDL